VGNTYVKYLGRLISAGLLPPTSDGRPTEEMGVAFVMDIAPQADLEDEEEEGGAPHEGGTGFHLRSTMPGFLRLFSLYCALRGWDVPANAQAAWLSTTVAIRKAVRDDPVWRTPPAFRRHVREAAEVVGAGAPGWWRHLRLEDTPRMDLLQMDVLVDSNSIHGRRQTTVAELTVGDASYEWVEEHGHFVVRYLFNRDGKCCRHGGPGPPEKPSSGSKIVTPSGRLRVLREQLWRQRPVPARRREAPPPWRLPPCAPATPAARGVPPPSLRRTRSAPPPAAARSAQAAASAVRVLAALAVAGCAAGVPAGGAAAPAGRAGDFAVAALEPSEALHDPSSPPEAQSPMEQPLLTYALVDFPCSGAESTACSGEGRSRRRQRICQPWYYPLLYIFLSRPSPRPRACPAWPLLLYVHARAGW
jgi:hypothetical protein